jgi:hypothetical protein
MGAIAGSWNALTKEQKDVYANMANNENGDGASDAVADN